MATPPCDPRLRNSRELVYHLTITSLCHLDHCAGRLELTAHTKRLSRSLAVLAATMYVETLRRSPTKTNAVVDNVLPNRS